MTKRVISVFLCVLCVISSISFIVSAKENKEYTSDNFLSVADGIIAWKKADNGSEPDGYLINDKYLENAGTTPGDWYPIALGRLGIQDNNEGYLAVIKDRVEERYRESGRLSAAKATEWHRIARRSRYGRRPDKFRNRRKRRADKSDSGRNLRPRQDNAARKTGHKRLDMGAYNS